MLAQKEIIGERSKKQLSERKGFWKQHEFLVLLLALLLFLFVPSFVVQPGMKDGLIYLYLMAVFLAGVMELGNNRRAFIAGSLLALTALLLNSFQFSDDEDLLFLLRMASLMAFFGMLVVHILVRVGKARRINPNVVYGAVNGYLLIGLTGGMGFRLIHHFYPGSFMLSNGLEPTIYDLTYFSFITLSTLGYGDIKPVSPPSQSLAILLSVIGPMYTAIVIGIIVGKFAYVSKRGKYWV